MIIQMITAQIGEGPGGNARPLVTKLVQPVARRLKRRVKQRDMPLAGVLAERLQRRGANAALGRRRCANERRLPSPARSRHARNAP